MAEQEQTPKPAGDPASTPGAPAAEAADAALQSAQAAADKLSADDATPPPEGSEAAVAAAADVAKQTTADAASAKKADPAGAEGAPVPLPDLTKPPAPEPSTAKPDELALLSDVNLHVKIELGRTRMLVEDVLRLGEGSVVELDKPAGDPVDVYVNERHVARGEVLVVNENFCVRISEIIDGVKPGDG